MFGTDPSIISELLGKRRKLRMFRLRCVRCKLALLRARVR